MRPAVNRIRELRVKKGWTEGYKFAERVGISGAFLSEIETGRKPGSLDVFTRIAKVLHVSIDTLRLAPDPTEENILTAARDGASVRIVGTIQAGSSDEEVTMNDGETPHDDGADHFEITDDSLAPDLYPGDLVRVAWGVPVEANRLVIAEFAPTDGPPRLTVKVLVERAGLRILAPVNFTRYPSVAMDARWSIKGVVTETIHRHQSDRYSRYAERIFGTAPAANHNGTVHP